MNFLNVKVVNEPPTNYSPYTLYFIKSETEDHMDVHMTSSDVTKLRLFQKDDFDKMLSSIEDDLQNIRMIDSFSTIFGTPNKTQAIYYNKNSHVSDLSNFKEMGKGKIDAFRMMNVVGARRTPYGRKTDVISRTHTVNGDKLNSFISLYKDDDGYCVTGTTYNKTTKETTDTSVKQFYSSFTGKDFIPNDDPRYLAKLLSFSTSNETNVVFGLIGFIDEVDRKYVFTIVPNAKAFYIAKSIKSNVSYDDIKTIYADKVFHYAPKTSEAINTLPYGNKYMFIVPAELKDGRKGHFVIKKTEAIFIETTQSYNNVCAYKYGAQLQFTYDPITGTLDTNNIDYFSTPTPEANANNTLGVGRIYLFNAEKPIFLGIGAYSQNESYPTIPLLFKRPNGEKFIIAYNTFSKTTHRVELDQRMLPLVRDFAVGVKGSQEGLMVISDTTNGYGIYVVHFWKNGSWSSYFYRLNDYHSFDYPNMFDLLMKSRYDSLIPINARNLWFKEHTPYKPNRILTSSNIVQ